MLNELLKALSNKDFVTARTCMESLLQDKIAEKIEEKKFDVTEQMFNVKESVAPYKQKRLENGNFINHSRVTPVNEDVEQLYEAVTVFTKRPSTQTEHGYSMSAGKHRISHIEKTLGLKRGSISKDSDTYIKHGDVHLKVKARGDNTATVNLAKKYANFGVDTSKHDAQREALHNALNKTKMVEEVEQIDEISQATKNSYMAKRGSQLSSMMYGSSKAKQLTGRQQKNAVNGIKRAKGENLKVQEDLDNIDTGLCEAKIDGPTAIKILNQAGGSTSDFHELGSAEVDTLLHHAKIHKYRKSPNAPGSTARMFHQHLTKIARRHADGYDGPSWK